MTNFENHVKIPFNERYLLSLLKSLIVICVVFLTTGSKSVYANQDSIIKKYEQKLEKIEANQDSFDNALHTISQILNDPLTKDYPMLRCSALLQQATIYLYFSETKRATRAIERAFKLNGKFDNIKLQFEIYRKLGDIYNEQDKIIPAGKYYTMAEEMCGQNEELLFFMPDILYSKAVLLEKNGKYKEANKLLFESLNLCEEQGNKSSEVLVLNKIGQSFFSLNNPDSSRFFFNKALDVNRDTIVPVSYATTLSKLSTLYYSMGEVDSAFKYLEKSQKIAVEYGLERVLLKNLYDYVFIYEEERDYYNALIYQSKANALQDSIINSQRQLFMQGIYNENEVIITHKQTEISGNRQSIRVLTIHLFILTLCIALCVFFFLVYRIRTMRKLHEKERLKHEVDLSIKNRELASTSIKMACRGDAYGQLLEEIEIIKNDNNSSDIGLEKLLKELEKRNNSNNYWEDFSKHFDEVHPAFYANLKKEFPNLSQNDLRLAGFLKMNLVTKEIANILSVSIRTVQNSKYRLKKKMNLQEDVNLVDYILSFNE